MRRIRQAVVFALAVLMVAAPAGLVLAGHGDAAPAQRPTLAEVARGAGCTLTEFRDGSTASNPPVTGRSIERILAADGSYAGRRPPRGPPPPAGVCGAGGPPPRPVATIHALLHGRVLFQYRPDVHGGELRALDRMTRRNPDRVLLFENRSGMHARVAATAYLSLMTCPRVDRATLGALAAFRDRRRAFGQDF